MTARMGPDHERWADASGAYVLGALPEGEAEAFATHLESCAACRLDVEDLETAAAALPASVMPMAAPAAIRDRVMAEVRREAELLAAAGEGADRPPVAAPRTRRRGWLRWSVPALAAAALLVGLVVGLGATGVFDSETTIPMAATGAARGAHARLVLDDGRATLEADHLPPPTGGRVYQVWLKPPGGDPKPTRSLFVPRADGHATVAVPAEAARMEAVLVTAEPGGGSPAPTSDPVLTAPLS
jgi:anti-sigma-K factor RskA